MKADPQTEAEILAIVERGLNALDVGDVETALLDIAEDALVYGTGADEKRTSHEELRELAQRDVDQAEAIYSELKWHSTSVSRAGSVAWFAADLLLSYVQEGRYLTTTSRFTGVLERRDGRWVFVQQHVSMPSEPPWRLGRGSANDEG